MSVLGGKVVGHYLEFFHRVNGRDEGIALPSDTASSSEGVIVDAVQRDIHATEATRAAGERKIGSHSVNRRRPCSEKPERESIAAIQRHTQNFTVVDDLAQGRCCGVHKGSGLGDFDGLGYGPNIENDRQIDCLVDLQRNAGKNLGLKSGAVADTTYVPRGMNCALNSPRSFVCAW